MTLPEPLLPAHVDLRGYGFMPLYGHHLFGSEFNARASDAAWRAGVTLWWAAWNQVPAGSLPDDDAALCRLADLGRDVKGWKRLREHALHGFVRCTDGRLYHKYLCELAAEAWDRRVKERERKAKYRAARERDRDGAEAGTGTGTKTGHEQGRNGREGQGQGQREGQGEGERTTTLASQAKIARAPEPDVPRETPADYREHWLAIQAKYPRGPTRGNWILAERNALALVTNGKSTWAQLEATVAAYAAFCRATARLVCKPEDFFAQDGEDRWAGDWTVPKRERISAGGLTESAKRWGEDDAEVAHAGG